MPETNNSVRDLHEQLTEGNHLARYLSRHASNADEAAEIYQESIVRVLEQAKQSAIRHPLAYVIRVARNLLIKNSEISIDDVDEMQCNQPNPEETFSQQQRVELITQALNTMPSQRRRVFIMRRIDGESRQAIAAKLGLSIEAVSKHLSRAMADIQRQLDKNLTQ